MRSIPALGQGTSHSNEEAALRTGISLGLTLIDTAEIYHTEELVGRAIAGQRDKVFLVSKIWPTNVGRMQEHCNNSLQRLGTDYLDLYLLHWPDGINDFVPVVASFEALRKAGKIRAWGVSNFNVQQLETLTAIPGGENCIVNQVLYNLAARSIERELLPWCKQRGMLIMAYSPLGGPGSNLLNHPVLQRIAFANECSPATIALAWITRNDNVVAIPKADSVEHVQQNALAFSIILRTEELQELDAAFPL